MNQDATLQEIREARVQIWHECGEDWSTLLSYYQSLEQEENGVLVKKPQNPQENSLASMLAA
jgi:hypothetical protein